MVNEQKGLQLPPPSDINFSLAGILKIGATFRNNKHGITIYYYTGGLGTFLLLTLFISPWYSLILVPYALIPFVFTYILAVKNPNLFSSEEHIEITTQQQLALQGNKKIGTQKVIDEQTLFFPEIKKNQSVKASISKSVPVGIKGGKQA